MSIPDRNHWSTWSSSFPLVSLNQSIYQMIKQTSFLLLFALLAGCSKNTNNEISNFNIDSIRLNQVGYYPDATKEFIYTGSTAFSFQVISEDGEVVFEGKLARPETWEVSGEDVQSGDFSGLEQTGKYTIRIEGLGDSYPFEIKENVYLEALNASIKSYYFQRASMAIDEEYGGAFARASGHMDNDCKFHPSSGKSVGSLNSPGGWYDAGDYGKYIVNASLSVGQMLNLVEIYPEVVKDSQLGITESGNGISDLLDELKYELDWIMTMQDDDGGVFHKLTALNFSGFVMPEDYDLERHIIGKGTAASLDFAAVMAQASRIYSEVDPDWAALALIASENAWNWAVMNDNIPFRNPEDVVTGEYGDDKFEDDFYWAASELFITTGTQKYQDYLIDNPEPVKHQITNSWKFFVRNMAFHSLITNRGKVNNDILTGLENDFIALADQILADIQRNPYNIGLDHFEWGSNSDVLNQAMILCYAHRLTGEEIYLSGVEKNVDYIFGKNATGYSFLTGFGSKQVMFPHHRPSGADGVEAPVPGFILGGPNKDKQDAQYVEYTSDYPARSFEDVQPSFASNEVCINWNAPAVFVLGYLEMNR